MVIMILYGSNFDYVSSNKCESKILSLVVKIEKDFILKSEIISQVRDPL